MNTPFKDLLSQKYPDEKERIEEERRRKEEDKKQAHLKEMEEVKQRNRENDAYKYFVKEYIHSILYSSIKKNFLYHLVVAYSPFTKITGYHLFPEGKQDTCCFCKTKVMNFEELSKQGTEAIINNDKINVDVMDGKITQGYADVLKKKERDKIIFGWTTKDTSTVMCAKCMNHFTDWIKNSLLYGESLVQSAIKKSMYAYIKDK
jgi:hypothetical protein